MSRLDGLAQELAHGLRSILLEHLLQPAPPTPGESRVSDDRRRSGPGHILKHLCSLDLAPYSAPARTGSARMSSALPAAAGAGSAIRVALVVPAREWEGRSGTSCRCERWWSSRWTWHAKLWPALDRISAGAAEQVEATFVFTLGPPAHDCFSQLLRPFCRSLRPSSGGTGTSIAGLLGWSTAGVSSRPTVEM